MKKIGLSGEEGGLQGEQESMQDVKEGVAKTIREGCKMKKWRLQDDKKGCKLKTIAVAR